MMNFKRMAFLMICVALGLGLSSCSGGGDESVTDGPSVGVPPPGGTPDRSQLWSHSAMYIRLASADANLFTSYMSKENVFGTDCSIPSTEENEHIECLVDILEEDMYFYGYGLEINVPKEMCDYATFIPYWYYNYEVGIGPSSVILNIETKIPHEGESHRTKYTCSVDGVDKDNCSGFVEVSIDQELDTVSCIYDKSDLDGGTNCCLGDYTLTKNFTNISVAEDGTETTLNTEQCQ